MEIIYQKQEEQRVIKAMEAREKTKQDEIESIKRKYGSGVTLYDKLSAEVTTFYVDEYCETWRFYSVLSDSDLEKKACEILKIEYGPPREEMTEHRERLKSLNEAASQALTMLDADAIAEEMKQYHREHLRPFKERHKELPDRIKQTVDELLATEPSLAQIELEARIKQKDLIEKMTKELLELKSKINSQEIQIQDALEQNKVLNDTNKELLNSNEVLQLEKDDMHKKIEILQEAQHLSETSEGMGNLGIQDEVQSVGTVEDIPFCE